MRRQLATRSKLSRCGFLPHLEAVTCDL